MGIWFIVMGVMEMFGAFAFRHAVKDASRAGDVSVPGQRARDASADSAADSAASSRRFTG